MKNNNHNYLSHGEKKEIVENSTVPQYCRRLVSVAVPATSANMGGGFDSIGIALNIWNELTLEISDKFSFNIEGEGENELPKDNNNLIVKGVMYAYKIMKKDMPENIKYTCKNKIPHARGLGSSSAAIISGMFAGLLLGGYDLQPSTTLAETSSNDDYYEKNRECKSKLEEILYNFAADIEGHPDNVAPAIFGGMQIGIKLKKENCKGRKFENVGQEETNWIASHVKIATNIRCIIYVPDATLETSKGRSVLPQVVDRNDAVFNLSRVAFLINLLSNSNGNNLDMLKYAMEDQLHQPYRLEMNPHLQPIIEAALDAGACGAYLSGSGPSVLIVTNGKGNVIENCVNIENKNKKDNKPRNVYNEKQLLSAVINAAEKVNVKGRIFVTYPTEFGAYVVNLDPQISTN